MPDTRPDAFVFAAAVKRANERRLVRDLPPLRRITPHRLRRTYISALLAFGWEVPVVMAEVGHTDPKVTLGIYAQVMRRDEAARDRLRGAELEELGGVKASASPPS